VFGVWAPNEDVAKLAYYGLYALQHRGQESAGIAVSDGSRIVVHKEMGLVAQVFDEPALTALRGHIAVGHCRYSTTGASVWANAQPTFRSTGTVSLALGHNGNLINTRELAGLLSDPQGGRGPGSTGIEATSDTDVLTALFVSDPAALGRWIGRIRARGVTLPLQVGLAGPAERTRLLRMATVAGASESARFITRHPGWILRFWVPGGYSPDRFLDRAAPAITAPGAVVAGLHLFTFNQLQPAERWRKAALERTGIDQPRLAG